MYCSYYSSHSIRMAPSIHAYTLHLAHLNSRSINHTHSFNSLFLSLSKLFAYIVRYFFPFVDILNGVQFFIFQIEMQSQFGVHLLLGLLLRLAKQSTIQSVSQAISYHGNFIHIHFSFSVKFFPYLFLHSHEIDEKSKERKRTKNMQDKLKYVSNFQASNAIKQH